MRLSIALTIISFVLIAAFHLADLQTRERLMGRHSGDLRKAAELIDKRYGLDAKGCNQTENSDDIDRLVWALATVENFATPKLEHFIEAVLVRFALDFGFTGLDFSLGPGQIRPSTFEKIFHSSSPRQSVRTLSSRRMPYLLLEVCSNLRLLKFTVNDILQKQHLSSSRLDRQTVAKVAQKYNGQAESPLLAGGFSHAVYNELVFNLFQLYRFRSLSL